jgi:NAD(P)-dependent dehydrogenase (short-subunit alcohol dehydrogenase family)
MKALSGKAVIITGGGRNLGRDYARFFAEEGAAVCVADIDGKGAAKTAAEIVDLGGQAIAVKADITSVTDTITMAERCVEAFDRIDVLVNNAALWGDLLLTPILTTDPDYWDTVMATNVKSVFLCVRAVLPTMRAQRSGRIINISCVGAWRTGSLYTTTKAAVNQLTWALAHELGPDNITINAVAPGSIDNAATLAHVPRSFLESQRQSMAIQRFGTSRDVYALLCWLASEEASWVTGQTISPNGGSEARY